MKEPVANVTIGGVTTPYTDLHEAVEAAKNGGTLELLCNVDLAGKTWAPVANFNGTFDGAGFTISNLTVSAAESTEIGFIGKVSGGTATIKNVTFAKANVAGKKNTAVIVGQMSSSIIVTDVVITDCEVTADTYAGGVFGHNGSHGAALTRVQVLNSTFVTTAGTDENKKVGALFGYCDDGSIGSTSFTDCTVKGNTIDAGRNAGAVAGQANGRLVFTNLIAEDNTVKKAGVETGALFGGFAKDRQATITGEDTDVEATIFCEEGEYFNKPILTGGTYTIEPTADVATIADGYKVVDNGDDTWTVLPRIQVALTISAENATVDGIEAGTVYEGSNLTFTVAANTGYKLVDVKANGAVLTDKEGNYTYAVTGEEAEQALAIVVTMEEDV